MKKIPTLFVRDWEGNRSLVTSEPNLECDWVFRDEGTATRKWDGTSCLMRVGRLFKRFEHRPGRTMPEGFISADEVDVETGRQPGWVPVGDGPEDHAHRDALSLLRFTPTDGTYELVGPKVQGNPEETAEHQLWRHGTVEVADIARDFDSLKAFLSETPMEGIVFHHPEGRMAKIKSRDFGIAWPRVPEARPQ